MDKQPVDLFEKEIKAPLQSQEHPFGHQPVDGDGVLSQKQTNPPEKEMFAPKWKCFLLFYAPL